MVRKFFLLLLLPIFLGDVFAHSNYLFDIGVDFNPSLESTLVGVARNFFGIDSVPVRFDYDRELLVVQFDNAIEKSVFINPFNFEVHGFRDDSKTVKGNVVFGFAQRKDIALSVFESLNEEYRSELVYGGEETTYEGNFKHLWYRYVNGVFVSNEYLEVEVNGVTGEVIAYKLYLFNYDKSVIKVSPAISSGLALEIGRLKFNGEIISDFEPVLIVGKNVPVWVYKLKLLYPIYVGVSGLTGEVLWSGNLRTILPQDYDVGKNVEIVENDFIKQFTEA